MAFPAISLLVFCRAVLDCLLWTYLPIATIPLFHDALEIIPLYFTPLCRMLHLTNCLL